MGLEFVTRWIKHLKSQEFGGGGGGNGRGGLQVAYRGSVTVVAFCRLLRF